jgi:hypothetical protein
MSDGRSSPDLRSLFAAAKGDAPSAAARTKVWGGVSQTLGVAASAGTVGIAGVGAAKMLVVGTLLGGAISAGIAATAIYVRPVPATRDGALDHVAAIHESFEPGTPRIVPASRPDVAVQAADPRRGSSGAAAAGSIVVPVSYSPGAPAVGPAHGRGSGFRVVGTRPARATISGSTPSPGGDDLAREAGLLSSARSALAADDATSALRALRATASIHDRQLVPEGLTLEAQALHALGRDGEASAVEARIKALYPESALAR